MEGRPLHVEGYEGKVVPIDRLLVGGPNLAAQALVAGLVDELALFVWPILLGGRNRALPTGTHVDLELIDEHRFSNGVVHLRDRLP